MVSGEEKVNKQSGGADEIEIVGGLVDDPVPS